MEFRKMVMITLYVRQQKRHRCKEQTLDSVGAGEDGMVWENCIKTCIYHMWNRLPVQIRCMRQGAQGRKTGMTLRDGMGREVGGGSGWGTHVHPWLIHVNVWQKTLQYCKVISLLLKKKNQLLKVSISPLDFTVLKAELNMSYKLWILNKM